MDYRALTEQQAVEFARKSLSFFDENSELRSHEIGDGNLNLVFKIWDEKTGRSIILKQALPHLRVVGESWPLTIDRSRIETEAMRVQTLLSPGSVPIVYHHDDDLAFTIMEDLSYLQIMRFELMKMRQFPKFPKQIGEFMARVLFYTSDLAMDPIAKKGQVAKFSNPELCKITEDLIFTHPYYDARENIINPQLVPYLRQHWWTDRALRLEVTKLKELFMNKSQALLHGDLHTGSIFIDQENLKVFDAEFAFYGPSGFDVGAIIANLVLNYASWTGRDDKSQVEIAGYRQYLIDSINQLYHCFRNTFSILWDMDAREEYREVKGYKEYYLQNLLQDTAGFAGCKINRRIISLAHVADLDCIENEGRRAEAQILALKIGRDFIMKRQSITCIEDLTSIMREHTNTRRS